MKNISITFGALVGIKRVLVESECVCEASFGYTPNWKDLF